MSTEMKWSGSILAISPQFLVLDLNKAVAFYRDKLAFRPLFIFEGNYASVARDGISIHLKLSDERDHSREFKKQHQHLDAYIYVEDAASLYAEYQNEGLDFLSPLTTTEWNTLEFVLEDLDENILYFAQDLTEI